jgi:hypothetical protein
LGLFHPGYIEALQRFDVLGIVGLHALEDDERAVLAGDLRAGDVEEVA